MMNRKFRYLVVMMVVAGIASPALAGNSFYEERYRGWLWFEEKQEEQDGKTSREYLSGQEITPEEAKAEVEAISKELDDLKYVYLARPSFESGKAYRDKLGEILDRGIKMQQLWDEQNFIEPGYRDLVNSPENVFAVKLNRKIKSDEDKKIIDQFAKNYELVFFFRKTCPRSSEFEPVLKLFGETHQIKVEAVSVDGSKSEYFPTSSSLSEQLIQKLEISATPTVIAIRNDGKRAFELIRGFVTLSELEQNTVKAWQLIEEQGVKVGLRR